MMVVAILTCYNEARTIRSVLERLSAVLESMQEEHRIVVIDDGSTDGSPRICEEFAAESGGTVEVVRFERNRGVGAVFRAGLTRALALAKAPDDMVVIVEADGTNELSLLPRMRDAVARGADLVVASRYMRGARVEGVPAHRLILSRALNLYLHRRFRRVCDITDFSYFFKAMSVRALESARKRYADELITSAGFAASSELVIKLAASGAKVVQLPTEYLYHARGESKLRVWPAVSEYIDLLARLKRTL